MQFTRKLHLIWIRDLEKSSLRLDVELSNSEFVLIEKVCKILTFFEQATKMMSEGDASISLSIPVVTTIMLSLKVKKGQDLGVIQLKNGLSDESGVPHVSGKGRD